MSSSDLSTAAAADGDERRLLAALQAGEPSAFERIVRDYSPRMLAVAKRFLTRDEDAQDAVQEAFLSAFRALGSFQGDARLATWLHRITVNACLMKLRSARRRPEGQIDDLLPKYRDDGHKSEATAAWAVTVDTAVDDRETRRLVRSAIEKLPESFRTVLLLRDIEEKSTDETASLLGLTESAVKTRLHRARLALRNLLDPYFREARK